MTAPGSEPAPAPCLVLGIGAAEGDARALASLLVALRDRTELAVVVVTDGEPDALRRKLGRHAPRLAVPGREAALHAGCRVLARPGTRVDQAAGRLVLARSSSSRVQRPIDQLLRSLAREARGRAAGIVLAQAARDGLAGLHDLQAAGCLAVVEKVVEKVVAQGPVAAGSDTVTAEADLGIDLWLPLAEIPAAVARFAGGARGEEEREAVAVAALPTTRSEAGPRLDERHLGNVLSLLAAEASLEVGAYKRATIERRVLRRMALIGSPTADSYLERLRADPEELRVLGHSLLISVTDFFRDQEAFATLRSVVIDPAVGAASPGETLRAWVPGCATGQEAYSIAIEFREAIARSGKRLGLQVFATDVDQDALATARTGAFPPALVERIRPDLRQRYFQRFDSEIYRVRPLLRDVVSFAPHDLTRDAPLSRMHLVSCRNVLIYLRPQAQERVLSMLHFALRPGGSLFLGSSESTAAQRELFETVAKKWRIFRKGVVPSPPLPPARRAQDVAADPVENSGTPLWSTRHAPLPSRRAPAMNDLAQRIVMQARVPPTLVVGESGRILFMHGELRPFLRFPEGEPRFELGALVTPDLATRTRAALYRCRRDRQTVVAHSTPDERTGGSTKITATPSFELGDGAVILTFEAVAADEQPAQPASERSLPDAAMVQLERELQATREDLQHTVEELESRNEELRSANEEATSMNEELQSANEELEATAEELRSLNEELASANTQLRDKVDQIEEAHDDIANFFASTKVATLFLDERLCIKRFTPAAAELLQIDQGASGRFIGDVARDLLQGDLVAEAKHVLEHFEGRSRELATANGRWLVRRVLPYRTQHRRIEGIVVTFTDVTELKNTVDTLSVRERQQAVIARLGIHALEDPDLQTFLEHAVREIQETLETDLCKVLELQPDGGDFLLRAGVGWDDGLVGRARVSAGLDSQAGYTLQTIEPVLVEDLARERRFSGPPLLGSHGVVAGMSCVIHGSEGAYGVLGVHSRTARTFTREDANFLQGAAAIVAGTLSRHLTRKRLVLESAAARALTQTRGDLAEVVGRIHATAGDTLKLVVAELWEPRPDGTLERTALFAAPPLDLEQVRAELQPAVVPNGEGTVGRVFTQRRAEWTAPAQEAPLVARGEALQHLSLPSGLAVPIVGDRADLGVMTFLSARPLHADGALLRALEGIGRHIGDFMRRHDIERRFRLTIDSAPVGIAERDGDGRWVRVNEQLCAITGYSADELVGASPEKLVFDDVPVDEPRGDASTEHAGDPPRRHAEVRLARKDGTPVWVSVTSSVVGDGRGRSEYWVDVVEDISARRAAEDELRDSEARFREVLLHSPVPLMVLDDAGNVVGLSRSWSEVTGYRPEDIPTVSDWRSLAYRERADAMTVLSKQVWTENAPHQAEFDVWTKAGETRTLRFHSVPIGKSPDGRNLRVVAAADLTQQRRFERDLVEASRQKDEFIAMLGHELRNPLAALRSAAEVLKRMQTADDLERVRGVLDRQTLHMAKLLDGLLDLSRIIRGKIAIERRAIELAAVAREVVEDSVDYAAAAGLQLNLVPSAEPLWIEGDAVRLTQIVDNLLANAIKHTPPAGVVTVELRREGEEAVLSVRDTGDGIDAELLPGLFEPFRQGRQSFDRARGGLGIGLALVRQLVELHGGRVSAHSEGPGRGSEFVVRIPVTSAPSGTVGRPKPSGRHRVVLIEDNEDAAVMLHRILELQGHDVRVALRGADGVELARSFEPDVVVCDLGLPDGMTGYDVATTLRGDARTRGISLVALSGYARPEDKERSRAAGFDAHLAKPLSIDELDRVLRELSA